jgi:hypothetical protein
MIILEAVIIGHNRRHTSLWASMNLSLACSSHVRSPLQPAQNAGLWPPSHVSIESAKKDKERIHIGLFVEGPCGLMGSGVRSRIVIILPTLEMPKTMHLNQEHIAGARGQIKPVIWYQAIALLVCLRHIKGSTSVVHPPLETLWFLLWHLLVMHGSRKDGPSIWAHRVDLKYQIGFSSGGKLPRNTKLACHK